MRSPEFIPEGLATEAKLLDECTAHHEQYLPYNKAIEVVRENQPKQLPKFATELQDAIDYLLNPEEVEGTGKVKFFTASESTLDKYHGTDGFIEYAITPEKTTRITFDLTMNPNKVNDKVDVIIQIPEEGINNKMNPKLFRETVEKAAQEITKKIKKTEVIH